MSKEKTTVTLPTALYHALRSQARKQNLSLPDFIEKRIKLQPANHHLASLPLDRLLRQTAPRSETDSRIDFYA